MTEAALLEAADLDAVDAEVEARIDRAVAAARSAPRPDPAEVATGVYVSYP